MEYAAETLFLKHRNALLKALVLQIKDGTAHYWNCELVE